MTNDGVSSSVASGFEAMFIFGYTLEHAQNHQVSVTRMIDYIKIREHDCDVIIMVDRIEYLQKASNANADGRPGCSATNLC